MASHRVSGIQPSMRPQQSYVIVRVPSVAIAYSDLSKRLRSISIDPHGNPMRYLLEQVSRDEHAAGRGLLSVVVVHKNDDMEPGNGFYTLAEELGFDVSNREKFWISEFKKVTDYWRLHPAA